LTTEWITSRPRIVASPAPSERAPCRFEAVALSPPEQVVLAARVESDHGPHRVVVRLERHPRRPGEVEDREVGLAREHLEACMLRLAERRDDGIRIGDGLRHESAWTARSASEPRIAVRQASTNRSRVNITLPRSHHPNG
jgi:hypothetical protein